MLNLTDAEKKSYAAALKQAAIIQENEDSLILEVIYAAESKYYRKLGHATVLDFIENGLKIASTQIYAYHSVANRALLFPNLKKALETKQINLGKAARISASLTNENAEEFVAFACANTFAQINKKVAAHKDPGNKRESAQQKGDVVVTEIFPTLDEWNLIERARTIEGNAKRSRGIKDTVIAAVKTHLYKYDPVEKAKRGRATANTKPQTKPNVAQIHAVNLRDQGKCTFEDATGKRCNNEKWVHKHHVVAPNQGGTHDPENLQTLCAYHHDLVHQLEFAFEKHADHSHHAH